jgi:hypothetical protein
MMDGYGFMFGCSRRGQGGHWCGKLIGISPIMRKLRVQAAMLAEADVPVLILGEGALATSKVVGRANCDLTGEHAIETGRAW